MKTLALSTFTALTLSLAAPVLHAAGPRMASTGDDRGRYLVSIMGCNDCHTPFKMGPAGPEPDMTRFLSGHPAKKTLAPAKISGSGVSRCDNTAFFGPTGHSAPNLTPDAKTGLGAGRRKTHDTVRNGKHLGIGRPILPPMPWPVYRNASDEDQRRSTPLRTIPPSTIYFGPVKPLPCRSKPRQIVIPDLVLRRIE
jgi:hypothetical protein